MPDIIHQHQHIPTFLNHPTGEQYRRNRRKVKIVDHGLDRGKEPDFIEVEKCRLEVLLQAGKFKDMPELYQDWYCMLAKYSKE